MSDNPFDVTKAVDFTDAEIAATWVNWAKKGPESFVDPRTPMPTFVTGGKGGGRTHLLRYFSYPLQRLRHSPNVVAGLQKDGYIGIYLRCSGLNSSRFQHKGQSDDAWSAVFTYYMEIWLGRLVLDLIADLLNGATRPTGSVGIPSFADAVYGLFDTPLTGRLIQSLDGLVAAFRAEQRALDRKINNAALTGELNVTVRASHGSLVFGIPEAASRDLGPLAETAFVYLLDEYENLTEEQQCYINTLIREKQLPARFLIGSRRYGIRTHRTLSAGEENREGSEYQLEVLEDIYRKDSKRYGGFCANIVQRRLAGSELALVARAEAGAHFLMPTGGVEERAGKHVEDWGWERTRPWIERLRKQLQNSEHASDTAYIVEVMEFAGSPLHEKLAILLLYRAWANGEFLRVSAGAVRERVQSLLDGSPAKGVATTYKHYRHDLYAQLLKALNQPSEYYGFPSFVRMSGYLPRNLLVILKQITRWSLFCGEQPFRGSLVSERAQQEGVSDASAWFLSDAKGLGPLGEETERAIDRLGSLFRDMRYSDKPAEVSCASFSTNHQGLSVRARNTLRNAVNHSLLLAIPTGRRDRNSGVLHYKYQLNPMLAPRFDLPLGRRGSASFSPGLLNCVFDASVAEASFRREQRRLLARLHPPFRGSEAAQGRLELG